MLICDDFTLLFYLLLFTFYVFPFTIVNKAEGCCTKIKVDSQGIAKSTHFWALGIFDKSDKLTEPAYKQSKSPDNSDQYYLEGSEKVIEVL